METRIADLAAPLTHYERLVASRMAARLVAGQPIERPVFGRHSGRVLVLAGAIACQIEREGTVR